MSHLGYRRVWPHLCPLPTKALSSHIGSFSFRRSEGQERYGLGSARQLWDGGTEGVTAVGESLGPGSSLGLFT